MNEKKYTIICVCSFVGGLVLTIVSLVLLLTLDSIYFMIPAFIGAFMMTTLPMIFGKKMNIDVEEALSVTDRNLMQELSYRYLLNKELILPLSEYDTDYDIGLKQTRIGFIKKTDINNKNKAIYIDMNFKKFTVKSKGFKETRYFKNFSDLNSVITEIRDIINKKTN